MSAPIDLRPGHALVEWVRLDEKGSPRKGLWLCRRVDGVVLHAYGDQLVTQGGYVFVADDPAPVLAPSTRGRDLQAYAVLMLFGLMFGAALWFSAGGR